MLNKGQSFESFDAAILRHNYASINHSMTFKNVRLRSILGI